jgi:hypothetical protein
VAPISILRELWTFFDLPAAGSIFIDLPWSSYLLDSLNFFLDLSGGFAQSRSTCPTFVDGSPPFHSPNSRDLLDPPGRFFQNVPITNHIMPLGRLSITVVVPGDEQKIGCDSYQTVRINLSVICK